MKPVIQEEKTGCAIACAEVIAGISYEQAEHVANSLDSYAESSDLSDDVF